MHPSFLGATQVYDNFILPRIQEQMHNIEKLEKEAKDMIKKGAAKANQLGMKVE
jgi:hypothetical protein